MENIHISYNDLLTYVLAFNIVLGFLFGVFPLAAGIKMHNRKYGVFGLVSAVFGGAIAGVVLAFPAAAIFMWLIMRDAHPHIDAADHVETESEDN
jgi:hypothetical protein